MAPAFTRPGTPVPDGGPSPDSLTSPCPGRYRPGTARGRDLGRIGPITASQARRLARAAARDPGTEWRIIVTTTGGHALAVTRIPRPRGHPPGPGTRQESGTGAGTRPGASVGLVGRVTLTIREACWPTRHRWLGMIHAPRSSSWPCRRQTGQQTAPGLPWPRMPQPACAHTAACAGYRPPPRLREYIAARDLTCRFLRCRQPAWRGDLDHTIAFDDGGRTCRCNLGGLCRTHHILKHHPDWKLRQITPGIFAWTTPACRTYTATPDVHAA